MIIGRCHQTNNPARSAILTFVGQVHLRSVTVYNTDRACFIEKSLSFVAPVMESLGQYIIDFFCVYSFENTQKILKVLNGSLKVSTSEKHSSHSFFPSEKSYHQD